MRHYFLNNQCHPIIALLCKKVLRYLSQIIICNILSILPLSLSLSFSIYSLSLLLFTITTDRSGDGVM